MALGGDEAVGTVAIAAALALFLVATGLCAWEMRDNTRSRDPEFEASTEGSEMRRGFHRLLFLGCLARSVSLGGELLVFDSHSESGDGDDSFAITLIHNVPDLLFLSTFSLLVLFWAQTCYAASGSPIRRLRVAFGLSNGLLYCVFTAGSLAFAFGSASAYIDFSFSVLGAAYVLLLLSVLRYGFLLLSQLRESTPPSDEAAGRLVRRMTCLLGLCSSIFVFRAAYYVGNAAHLFSWRLGRHGDDPKVYAVDSCALVLVEFLPTLLILAMMHRKAPRSSSLSSLVLDHEYGELAGSFSSCSSSSSGGSASPS